MKRIRCEMVALVSALSGLAGGCADEGSGNGDSGETSATSGTSESSDAASASSDTTGPGTTTDSTATGSDTGPGPTVEGCDGAVLRANPSDPAAPGPWSVGVRTVDVEGLTVEVWYPAPPGSEAGADPVVYDIREALPESEQSKISDEDNPPQRCDCYRDLPVDVDYGPYPAIVFIHGTAGFRTQSLPQMVHWASRGFVVIAADHPGLWLADTLGSLCGGGMQPQDLAGDRARLVAAIRGQVSGLEFVGERIDDTRIGMAGHSAGGNAISDAGSDAQVVVPMAAGGVSGGASLQSVLVMGGTADSVVQYSQQVSGYESSPAPKRLVGLDGAGHLAFSEICSLSNAAGQDLLEIATENGVCGAQFAGFLFQCDDALLPDADGWEIIDFSTAAAFEQTLHCSDIGAAFDEIEQRFDGVFEFRSE